MAILCVVILCGWIVLGAAAGQLCGTSVDYTLPRTALCLQHNASSSAPVTAVLHHSGRLSTMLQLVPGQPVDLLPGTSGTRTLSLRSSHSVCFFVSRKRCREGGGGGKEGERETRDAHTIAEADEKQDGHSPSSHVMLLQVALSAAALLVLPPLAMAAFLCCPAGDGRTQTRSNRRFSRKDRKKGLSASTDISINITDSDHPLGSDLYTTFHKDEAQGKRSAPTSQSVSSPVFVGMASGDRARSEPSLLEKPSTQGMQDSTQQLLESSLDIGTRPTSSQDAQRLGASLSSLLSLGPRVSPEGSSLGNISSFDKHPSPQHLLPNMPPPPLVRPHSTTIHIRQHSHPVSFPTPPLPSSPPHRPRPLTIIGKPTDQHPRLGQRSPVPATPPVLPPKPHPPPSSPPLSPVSLSESEALCSVRPGRVRPYRVVHQPSSSLSSLPHLPHSSDGAVCTLCGARLSGNTEPESPQVVGAQRGGGATQEPSDELCQQCQVDDPHYQELELSDDDTLYSPPPLPLLDDTSSPLPDPVYERIGSIRRHLTMTTSTSRSYTSISSEDRSDVTTSTFHPLPAKTLSRPSRPPPPSPPPSESSVQSSSVLCSLPPGSEGASCLPKCPLGAPLPPRPPTLGLLTAGSTDSNHDYESLPSTFDQQSPRDTVLYARIPSPEEGEPESPPFVPENSQRAQMLKIDSQGYAEVLNKEREDGSDTPDPDHGYSPLHLPRSPPSQAMASDYEVPIRITSLPTPSPHNLPPAPTHTSPFLQTSPTHFHTSPPHSHPSPIPVPSPVCPSPSLHSAPSTLPLPSERQSVPSTSSPRLTRQGVVTDNLIPVPTRSLRVFPREDRDSLEERRDSVSSTDSYHLTFRFSSASSTLGEIVSESLKVISEELDVQADKREGGAQVEVEDSSERGEGEARGQQGESETKAVAREVSSDHRNTDLISRQQKIYEVENRSRTQSYSNPVLKQPPLDRAAHKVKAQTMHMLISFNTDSQAV